MELKNNQNSIFGFFDYFQVRKPRLWLLLLKRFAKTPRSKELSLEATNAKFNTNTIRILRDTGSHRNTKHSSNPIWPIHHFLGSKKFIHFSVCFLLPHKKSFMFPMQLQLRARGLLLRDFFCPVRVIFSQTTYDNLRHRVEIYTLSVNYHITHFDMIENSRPPKNLKIWNTKRWQLSH